MYIDFNGLTSVSPSIGPLHLLQLMPTIFTCSWVAAVGAAPHIHKCAPKDNFFQIVLFFAGPLTYCIVCIVWKGGFYSFTPVHLRRCVVLF